MRNVLAFFAAGLTGVLVEGLKWGLVGHFTAVMLALVAYRIVAGSWLHDPIPTPDAPPRFESV